MDIPKLKHDPKRVRGALKKQGRTVKTTANIKIMVPAQMREKGLVIMGNEVQLFAMFAMILDDEYYCVSNTLAQIRITPDSTNTIVHNGEELLVFGFEANSTVFSNTAVVKNNDLVFEAFDIIVSYAKAAWYMDYMYQAMMFDTAESHAGANLGADHAIFELLVAIRARQIEDKTKYQRHAITKRDDLYRPMHYIPLSSVQYGATNTASKLIGARFDEGLTSALVYPSETVEKNEQLLRK